MSKKNQWRICDPKADATHRYGAGIYSGKSKNFNIKVKRSFWRTDSRFKGLLKGGLTVLISVLVIYTIVQAGSLTPSASPAATSYTLSDIYTRLTTNATSSPGDHSFSPSGSPAGTFYTLTQIYNAIPTIDPTKVLSGTSYLGVSGTAYGDTDPTKVLTVASVPGTYDATNLASSTVKYGITFGVNQTGAYPSADYPLPNADTGITDLTSDGTSITSSNGSVEWWQSDGTRQTATLDFPDLANVCSIDTSNNSAGALLIASSTIGVGNTYCGIAGTLLKDLFNGTGQEFTGGSQANGGVDDYNNAGSSPTDRYECPSGWTQCTADNNYCGTGLASADAKDNCTGLIWSKPCNGEGCDSFSDDSPTTYNWSDTGTNTNNWSTVQNATSTASGLCTNGDHQETGWYLPSQKQLMQAYIDGAYGNLEASGVGRLYWSGTTDSWDTSYAWYTDLSLGGTYGYLKTYSFYVRCVRSAN